MDMGNASQNMYATQMSPNQKESDFNVFDQSQQANKSAVQNINVPLVESLPATQPSLHENIVGLSIKAAIQR